MAKKTKPPRAPLEVVAEARNVVGAATDDPEALGLPATEHTDAGRDATATSPALQVNEPGTLLPAGDVLSALAALARGEDGIDHDARRRLDEQLARQFANSPEAAHLHEVGSCHFVMDYAADYCGATIATIGAADLEEVVFRIIPRKVTIDAAAAEWIVEENRAFFAYLKREFGWPQADACLAVLDGDAVGRLRAELSNPRNFGMAKSFMMGGQAAGHAMDIQEGLDAWLRAINAQHEALSLPWARAPKPPLDPAAARAKKNKEKAARRARQRSR